jgi:trk system potassium uptake protein TrkH|tara:strand:- start:39150 stop:40571 length:1422 start_codon:yes stop_codon:yes gene_type:complete
MVGGLAVCSGLIDLIGHGADSSTLLITGSGMGLLGALLFGRVTGPDKARPVDIIAATTLAMTLGILLVAGLYVMTGAAQRPDDALFEATTGITTTAMSVIDPTGLGYGLRFLRSGSQWLGGFAALLVGIVILPFFGFGREFADRSSSGGFRPLAPDEMSATRNILRLYIPGTGLIWGGYMFAGMSAFDGLLLAMSTVSTGGFTNGANEFADPSVQWVAIVGMLLAGSSMVTLWHLVVGRGGLHRQTGLTMYLGLHVTGVLLLVLLSTGIDLAAARRLLFVVAASVSTTGFPMGVPVGWPAAAPVLLLLLVSIGAMSGSAGGGFQIRQHRALMKLALREMARQLHPRAVLKVRLAGRVAGEDTLRQIVVLQFLFVAVIFSTAFLVAVFGLDLASAISAAVHATATAGPVRGLDGVMVDPTEWSRSVRLALLPAMVFGRLSIYPAVVAVAALLNLLRDKARVRRRYRAHRHGGSL